ncbi:unnamed protein product [Boreogadus saida]
MHTRLSWMRVDERLACSLILFLNNVYSSQKPKGPALCLDFQRGAAFYTFQKRPALYLPFPRGSAIQTFQTFQKGPSLYLAFVFADASTSPSPMPATSDRGVGAVLSASRMELIQTLIEEKLCNNVDYIFCFHVDSKFHLKGVLSPEYLWQDFKLRKPELRIIRFSRVKKNYSEIRPNV